MGTPHCKIYMGALNQTTTDDDEIGWGSDSDRWPCAHVARIIARITIAIWGSAEGPRWPTRPRGRRGWPSRGWPSRGWPLGAMQASKVEEVEDAAEWFKIRCPIGGCKGGAYKRTHAECLEWLDNHLTTSTADSHKEVQDDPDKMAECLDVCEEKVPYSEVQKWEAWEKEKGEKQRQRPHAPASSGRSRSRRRRRDDRPPAQPARRPQPSTPPRGGRGRGRSSPSPSSRGGSAGSWRARPSASADPMVLKTLETVKKTVEALGPIAQSITAAAAAPSPATTGKAAGARPLSIVMGPMGAMSSAPSPATDVVISAASCSAVIDCIRRAEACANTAAEVCTKAASAFKAEAQSLAAARADVETAVAMARRGI